MPLPPTQALRISPVYFHPVMTSSSSRALFLDRDGIINEDNGYPFRPSDIRFMPGIFPFCRRVRSLGYLLVVVTNQAGVAKGFFSEHDVEELHRWMGERFADEGCAIERFYYCPFHEAGVEPRYRTNLHMRKPGPGMILAAAADLTIDVTRSIMLGDKPSDRIALDGLRSIIMKSRYTPSGYDVASFDEALAFIADTGDRDG